MADVDLVVRGDREVIRGFEIADREARTAVNGTLLQAGEAVRKDAAGRINPKSAKTAGGYRVISRDRAVAVEQTVPKTSGLRPDWGGYQMTHALQPAATDQQPKTDEKMRAAMDVVAGHFNSSGVL